MPTEITVWDVQHGNAISVKTPNGKYIWCDAGTGSFDSGKEFSPYKRSQIPQIDILVLSHPHNDHVSDFWNIPCERVDRLLYNTLISQEYFKTLRDSTTPSFRAKKTLTKFLITQEQIKWGTVAKYSTMEESLTVIAYWAMSDIGTNANNYSVVVFLLQGKNLVCLPGDIEEQGWDFLRTSYTPYFENALRKTNILIASHHGRKQGWYSEFSSLCNPDIVVISDREEMETSITSDYDKIAKGHSVFKGFSKFPPPIARPVNKKCVSTRDNGPIVITLGNEKYSVKVQKGI